VPQVQPLGDRVAAEPLDGSSTPSGLVVATLSSEPPPIARIRTVGPDVKDLKVGDVIAYTPKAGFVELYFPGELPVMVIESRAVIARITGYLVDPGQSNLPSAVQESGG
jgi:co-chaperonin GroES (HSP10)